MSKDNSKENIIKTAYADVHKFGQNGEFEKALKAVNRGKESSPKSNSPNFYQNSSSGSSFR